MLSRNCQESKSHNSFIPNLITSPRISQYRYIAYQFYLLSENHNLLYILFVFAKLDVQERCTKSSEKQIVDVDSKTTHTLISTMAHDSCGDWGMLGRWKTKHPWFMSWKSSTDSIPYLKIWMCNIASKKRSGGCGMMCQRQTSCEPNLTHKILMLLQWFGE